MIVANETCRKSPEVAGGSILNFRQPPAKTRKSLKSLPEVHAGTVPGSPGSRIAKALNYMDNFSGGSAELSVPLKGGFCAKGCTTTPLGDGAICEACWTDPDTHYTGPAFDCAPEPLAAFWQDALVHTRAEMRTRWPEYRGKVPDGLAGVIVSDVEASGAFREEL